MRKSRFSEAQIVAIIASRRRRVFRFRNPSKYGISEHKSSRRRKEYGGMEANEVREPKQLREENRRLNGLVADLTLHKQALQEVLSTRI